MKLICWATYLVEGSCLTVVVTKAEGSEFREKWS